MAGFTLLLKLLTGTRACGLDRLAVGGVSKRIPGSASRSLGGGKGGGKGRGMGGGKNGGKGEGRGHCGCGNKSQASDHLAKIVELVALRLAERNAKPLAQTPAPGHAPLQDKTGEAAALPLPGRVTAYDWPQQSETTPATIDVRAVAMTAYACRMCGRRISVAADDPIADPRCPQCGGPMAAAPEA